MSRTPPRRRSSGADTSIKEILRRGLDVEGNHHLCLVERREMSTAETINAVAERLRLKPRDFRCTRALDQYGEVKQYLTLSKKLLRNPPRAGSVLFEDKRMRVSLLGDFRGELTADDVLANRYSISIRGLNAAQAEIVRANAEALSKFGLPNYAWSGGMGDRLEDYPAWFLFQGQYELALKAFWTAPDRRDRGRQRNRKRLFLQKWGNWRSLQGLISGAERPSLQTLIQRPKDFAGAIDKLPPTDKEDLIGSFRLFLFNRMLQRLIESKTTAEEQLPFETRFSRWLFFRALDPERQKEMDIQTLPLLGNLPPLSPEEEVLLKPVLEECRLPAPWTRPEGFGADWTPFSRREALLFPEDIRVSAPVQDDQREGQLRLDVEFTIQDGASERLVIQRLLAGQPASSNPTENAALENSNDLDTTNDNDDEGNTEDSGEMDANATPNQEQEKTGDAEG